MIIEVFPSGPLETNAFLLGCSQTKQGAIIDAPFECTDFILDEAKKQGIAIKMLLFTHSHWDHIAEAHLLQKATQAPVYIHKEDAENLQNPGHDRVPSFFPILGVQIDHFLKDGEILKLGQLEIAVIHTPGHTPGGCCFYLEKQNVLFSGDTLFKGTIGRLDLPTGRKNLMGNSLQKL
jgi:hydroxyacylglutathione hydrolase